MIISHMTQSSFRILQQNSNFFLTYPEKVGLRLIELRTWLKNNKYPDHNISNAFYNTKL